MCLIRLLAAVLLGFSAAVSHAQEVDSIDRNADHAQVSIPHPNKQRARPLGKFNSRYLRLGKLFPGNGFGNPVAAGFAGSEAFGSANTQRYPYALYFESGSTRHFMKLDLGGDMLKLAINSGVSVQACGAAATRTDSTQETTSGFYLLRLGLGPQLTFKPMAEIRLGLYYRAGIAAFYTDYTNERNTSPGPGLSRKDQVQTWMVNYAYNGDIGLDCSWRALSVGISYSMLTCRPSSGVLVSRDNGDNTRSTTTMRNGVQDGATIITPIDPAISFNRFGVSIGFVF